MEFFNNDPINKIEKQNLNISNENLNNINDEKFLKEEKEFDDIETLNINQMLIDDSQNSKKNNSSFYKNKLFNIKGDNLNIYIENIKQFCSIKIPKSFDQKISIVSNESEIKKFNCINIVQADSIIGIFDLNDNKYLGVITSSTEIINFMDSNLYAINSIELIQITNNNESLTDINLLKNIKNLFSSRNFYYSNNYDLSLSLYNQYIVNNSDEVDNDNINNSKFLINSSLLKYFYESHIPDFFFCSIIFGYIGCQKEIYLDEAYNFDIIIIERYFNKNLIFNNDIPGYIKQIELICSFKNKFNKNLDKIFSFICYVSSESMKYINKFLPFKTILINEFNLYKKVICILNNINKIFDNSKINDVITRFNKSLLNNKINLIDFISNWDKDLFSNILKEYEKFIDYYVNDSDDIFQENIFWFIDINNYYYNDDNCFKTIIQIIWKVIQKEINFAGVNLNIGSFDQNNNNIIYNKINEIIIKYKNDLTEIKKHLLIRNKEKNQEVIDKFFSYSSIYGKNINENNSKIYDDINKKDNKAKSELKKIKLLCVTWNIAGIPNKNYNITELFTKNIFYNENKSPDIILISIQEIVKLNLTNILSIKSNQEIIDSWTKLIKSTLKNIFPKENYLEIKCLNLVGIFILILVKNELSNNIFLLDHNMTKRGMYGTLGNKGFFTISMKCYDKIISFGSGHFESGKSKNEERINTLIQLLNKPLNIQDEELITFKEVDYWIILGDLNFRIDLSYEEAISFIQEKNYDFLYNMDQFKSSLERNNFLKQYVNEKKINFDPTYKYEKESNEYAYDEDKIRVPAWTDRIFYCKSEGIRMLSYECVKSLRYSDHRPVVGAFEIDTYIKEKSISNMKKFNKKIENNEIELIDINKNEKVEHDLNIVNQENKSDLNHKMKASENLNNNSEICKLFIDNENTNKNINEILLEKQNNNIIQINKQNIDINKNEIRVKNKIEYQDNNNFNNSNIS